jgi:outer membrane scaffolding protein for murein synthesis (MipA/OmpV family)
MKKILTLLLGIFTSTSLLSFPFIDPSVNQLLRYVDKDGANNYAFINGLYEHKTKKEDSFLSLGVVGSKIYPRLEDKEHYYTAVPLINGKYKNFYTYGGVFNGVEFFKKQNLTLSLTAEYRFTGHDDSEFDSYLKELDDLDNPIMVGINGNYQAGPLIFTGGFHHNVRGTSDENTFTIGVLSGVPFRRFILLGYLGYEVMSNAYSDKYYGLPNGNYSDLRIIPYTVDGVGHVFRATTLLAYSVSQHIDVFAYYYFETFSDNIKNSTLMTGDNSHMFGLGATYTF